jgi:uncharacterized repeat protein (TIGR03803 family)
LRGRSRTPAGLIFDAAGNLYGTTYQGGTYGSCNHYGCGTVFKLTPEAGGGWTEKILYSFCPQGYGCADGAGPSASLIFDAAGNLYGTTFWGGIYNCTSGMVGCGTVFELPPQAGGGWTERVLHSFNSSDTDGQNPEAGLVLDAVGSLYGTTIGGGTRL